MTKLPLTLVDRLRIYARDMYEEFKHPTYHKEGFFEKLEGAISNTELGGRSWARYHILEEITKKAVKTTDARYEYDRRLVIHSKKEGETHRLLLVLPIKYSSEDKYQIKLDKEIHGIKPKKEVVKVIKYVVANNEEGKRVVVAATVGLHQDLVRRYTELTGETLRNITGGRFKITKKRGQPPIIEVYSCSQQYGQANHKEVVEILKKEGLNARLTED